MRPRRIYVGVRHDLKREIFRSRDVPTQETFPHYAVVIGPMRSKRGAIIMATQHYQASCVADAERIAREMIQV